MNHEDRFFANRKRTKRWGKDERERDIKEIKMCCVHVLTPHDGLIIM